VLDDFLPRFTDWVWDWLDVPALIRGAEVTYEFPMVDRDPLERWTVGRVTLLGDAAHPMYPIGSNGASQAIIDALTIADLLGDAADAGVASGSSASGAAIDAALAAYDAERRPKTAAIVLSNRQHSTSPSSARPTASTTSPQCSPPASARRSPAATSRPPASSPRRNPPLADCPLTAR
jgi:2-polyprenyl-6-methoxyphenol hydroxylase-like FAD-dependent oxidoreductase